jgi:hypothetical protein
MTYIVGALVLQQQIPGVDALTPGFLMALQERNPWQTLWLFIAFVLIQEGTGSLHFGSAVLWYGGQAALFHICERFFVSDNLLFVLMLSLFFGIYHILLVMFMCAVQGLPVELLSLLVESIVQVVLVPLVWSVVYFLRPASTYSM